MTAIAKLQLRTVRAVQALQDKPITEKVADAVEGEKERVWC